MSDPYIPDEQAPSSQGDGSGGPDAAAQTTEETALRRELDEMRDKYLRLAAEYENFRKRAIREREEARQRSQGDLVVGLLDALDDLARFAHLDPSATDAKTVVDGAELVERKLLKSLAGHGLEVIDPLDHPFDPALHEAVQTEPALSPEDDHMVGRVFQRGYVFNGRLLRPARVVVKQWREPAPPNE
ncbi:MAG: nucleotide exchange factor GrpE [Gemmatimonadaceae bacterium]